MVIVYQGDVDQETVIEAYETRSGIKHELTCINPKDLERGNCPIQWEIIFISEDGGYSAYDSNELENPSDLI